MKTKPHSTLRHNKNDVDFQPVSRHIINALQYLMDEALRNDDAKLALVLSEAIMQAEKLSQDDDSESVTLSEEDQTYIRLFFKKFLELSVHQKRDLALILERIPEIGGDFIIPEISQTRLV